MRNTLIALLLTAGVVFAATKPKWQNKKPWLYDLQNGFPESRARSLLGPPHFVITNSSHQRWYYQDIPRAVPITATDRAGGRPISAHTKALRGSQAGSVSFFRQSNPVDAKPRRPRRWTVNNWREPTWDNLPSVPPAVKPQKKPKPPRKLQRWERVAAWKSLTHGLPFSIVRSRLGEPADERREPARPDRMHWYYGNVQGCGRVDFLRNKLSGWTEPFWPEVDRNIYGDPNTTPSPPATDPKK